MKYYKGLQTWMDSLEECMQRKMKVQLVSNLLLFRLCLFHLDSEIYAIYLALLYQIVTNILLQTMHAQCCFNSMTQTLFAQVSIFSLILPMPTLWSHYH
jgi:hypothetical protein